MRQTWQACPSVLRRTSWTGGCLPLQQFCGLAHARRIQRSAGTLQRTTAPPCAYLQRRHWRRWWRLVRWEGGHEDCGAGAGRGRASWSGWADACRLPPRRAGQPSMHLPSLSCSTPAVTPAASIPTSWHHTSAVRPVTHLIIPTPYHPHFSSPRPSPCWQVAVLRTSGRHTVGRVTTACI